MRVAGFYPCGPRERIADLVSRRVGVWDEDDTCRAWRKRRFTFAVAMESSAKVTTKLPTDSFGGTRRRGEEALGAFRREDYAKVKLQTSKGPVTHCIMELRVHRDGKKRKQRLIVSSLSSSLKKPRASVEKPLPQGRIGPGACISSYCAAPGAAGCSVARCARAGIRRAISSCKASTLATSAVVSPVRA